MFLFILLSIEANLRLHIRSSFLKTDTQVSHLIYTYPRLGTINFIKGEKNKIKFKRNEICFPFVARLEITNY